MRIVAFIVVATLAACSGKPDVSPERQASRDRIRAEIAAYRSDCSASDPRCVEQDHAFYSGMTDKLDDELRASPSGRGKVEADKIVLVRDNALKACPDLSGSMTLDQRLVAWECRMHSSSRAMFDLEEALWKLP